MCPNISGFKAEIKLQYETEFLLKDIAIKENLIREMGELVFRVAFSLFRCITCTVVSYLEYMC